MANVLDMLGRAALRIGGMSPQQIRQQTRANKKPKPMPTPRASKPAPTPPRPPAPGSTRPVGQTSLFNAKGQPRDFRNPNVSANRPPTIDKAVQGPKSALKPGPVRPPAPGQMSLFGTNPGAKPAGNFRAPSVPGPGAATLRGTYGADALNWLKNNSAAARQAAAVSRAQLQSGLSKVGLVGTALAAADQARKVFNPKDNILTSLNDLRLSATNGGQVVPGHSRYQAPSQSGPVGPQQTPEMVANYRQERDARHAALRADLNAQPSLRPPASPAPAGGSVYAPRAGQPQRPNTPMSSAKLAPAAPSNPYAGIGDVRGNEMGAAPSGEFGVDKQNLAQPRTPTDTDYERRRAFLDADNSLDGMKAVRDLLKRRKLSISFSD